MFTLFIEPSSTVLFISIDNKTNLYFWKKLVTRIFGPKRDEVKGKMEEVAQWGAS
jgi:hypothetical protein